MVVAIVVPGEEPNTGHRPSEINPIGSHARGLRSSTWELQHDSHEQCALPPARPTLHHACHALPPSCLYNILNPFSYATPITTMSSASLRKDCAPKDATNIKRALELAPSDEPASLYPHYSLQTRIEDYSVSRVMCDTTSQDLDPIEGSSKVEALIMSEVADYLQSSHCDDFWRPRNLPPQKVSTRTAH